MLPKGWVNKTLDACVRFVSGGTPSKERDDYWSGDFPWVTAKDMKTFWLTDTGLGLTSAGKAAATIVPPGTVLVLTRGMTLLKDLPVGISNREISFNQDIKALIPVDGVDAEFLAFQLLGRKEEILELVDTAGHGTGRLDTEQLKQFQVHIPPRQEQRAIAKALGVWDNAIDKTEKLLVNSRRQKVALTHDLLMGRTRCAGFAKSSNRVATRIGKLPHDWKHIPIGEVACEVSTKNAGNEALPVLSCTKHQGLVDSLSYFNKRVFSEDTSTYKVVPRGAFAYATNHIDEGSIGYQDLYERALISPMYTVFRVSELIDHSYLFKLLKTEHYRQVFAANTNASVDRRGSLRWNEFKKIEIPVPSMDEQLAIGEVIDTASQEVEQLQAQLELLKQEKRALMADLLTGKRRIRLPESTAELEAT